METYYQRNKEKVLAYARARYRGNPDYIKKYREENRDKFRVYRKKYAIKQAEYYRDWYSKNGRIRTDSDIEKIREWCQAFPERIEIQRQVRNAVRSGKITRPDVCSKCGRVAKIQAHHVNYEHFMNFIWLCSSCHKKEHINKSP